MGLDCVELIIENEKFFNISIPDKQAERIITVQNFVDVIALHLNIESNEKTLQEKVLTAFHSAMKQQENKSSGIKITDKISDYVKPNDPTFFLELEPQIKLETPAIKNYIKRNSSQWDNVIKLVAWVPNYNWETLTVEDFINSTCAKNYLKLVNPIEISSKFEIYVAVVGITVEKIGVDYFEVSPDKSFTSDLGVD
jgi:acyl carrier protein